jgi:hypothetical protein
MVDAATSIALRVVDAGSAGSGLVEMHGETSVAAIVVGGLVVLLRVVPIRVVGAILVNVVVTAVSRGTSVSGELVKVGAIVEYGPEPNMDFAQGRPDKVECSMVDELSDSDPNRNDWPEILILYIEVAAGPDSLLVRPRVWYELIETAWELVAGC